jgi:hypothetical protein
MDPRARVPTIGSVNTHYSAFEHPNEQPKEIVLEDSTQIDKVLLTSGIKKDKRSCIAFIKKFDDTILKPFFIYKYKIRKAQPEIDYEGVLKEA